MLLVPTTHLPASQDVIELVVCGCKEKCVVFACSCRKHGVECTIMCLLCETECESRNSEAALANYYSDNDALDISFPKNKMNKIKTKNILLSEHMSHWIILTSKHGTWTLLKKLEDLEFAGDLALLSHCLQDMQDKVIDVADTAQHVELKISQKKTKLLHNNNKQEAPVHIERMAVEDVGEFVYMSGKISQSGGTDENIKARVKKA